MKRQCNQQWLLVAGVLLTLFLIIALAAHVLSPNEPSVSAHQQPSSTPTLSHWLAPVTGLDLMLTHRGHASKLKIGDPLTFTLQITHCDGSIPAHHVVLLDPLPEFLEVLDATTTLGDLSITDQIVKIEIETLLPGQVVTVSLLTRVATRPPKDLTPITATLSTTSPDRNLNNNRSTFNIIVDR